MQITPRRRAEAKAVQCSSHVGKVIPLQPSHQGLQNGSVQDIQLGDEGVALNATLSDNACSLCFRTRSIEPQITAIGSGNFYALDDGTNPDGTTSADETRLSIVADSVLACR